MEDQILQFFAGYAYKPFIVYSAIIGLLFLSSFGLPVPEEIVLVSTGIVCYMGMNAELFPPPYEGATPVNAYIAAVIGFAAVISSDLLVFTIGHHFGKRLFKFRIMHKYIIQLNRISEYTKKYGQWAAGIFRFTPGLRFPGHMTCGIMGLSYPRFIMVDGTAALLSVPTQILLVSYFGEEIIYTIKQFQAGFFILLAPFAAYFIIRFFYKRKNRRQTAEPLQTPDID
jgi:membrane protein DedA with SNARE-associated domain